MLRYGTSECQSRCLLVFYKVVYFVSGTFLKLLKLHIQTSSQYYLYVLLNMQKFPERQCPNTDSPSALRWKYGFLGVWSRVAYLGEAAPFITGSLFKYVAQYTKLKVPNKTGNTIRDILSILLMLL